MTPEAFRAWQTKVDLTARELAKRLGRNVNTIASYRSHGVPARESLTVRLALRAIADGRDPWPDDTNHGK